MRMAFSDDLDIVVAGNWLGVFSSVFGFITDYLAMKVVQLIQSRQKEKAGRIGTSKVNPIQV